MPETLAPPVSDSPAIAPITKADTSIHGFNSDAFSKLDALMEKPEKKETPKPPAKEAPKAPVKEAPKQAEAPKEKPVEPPKEEAKKDGETKPTDKQETKPAVEGEKPKPTAWQLAREWEKKTKVLEAEIETLKKTSTAAKPEEHPEFKKLAEERDRLAKANQELEEEIKYTNYERSAEYKTQYDAPYQRAFQDAIATISEFEVTEADGSTRPGNEKDFARIIGAKSLKEAKAIADELFGDPTIAAMALTERKRVTDAHANAERAKQEFRTKGTEREKQIAEQRAKQAKESRAQWEGLNEEAKKKYPDLFNPREGDEKFNEKLTKGFERVKAAFEGKSNPALDSMIYMKAGAFDALKHDLTNLKAQLKDAEAKIAEYEGSEPTPGVPEKETATVKELTAYEKIDRLGR